MRAVLASQAKIDVSMWGPSGVRNVKKKIDFRGYRVIMRFVFLQWMIIDHERKRRRERLLR